MPEKRRDDAEKIKALEQQLYSHKRAWRQKRWQRLKANGRVVTLPSHPPPLAQAPALNPGEAAQIPLGNDPISEPRVPFWKRVANNALFLVEILAVLGLLLLLLNLWRTQQTLNREVAQVQNAQSQALALPTPTATPVIDVVILPGGHQPPVAGQSPQPGEAGDIPPHLLPVINAYQPPPQPTPFPEMARRIEIPAIQVNAPVVQNMYDWEQLKRGVAQKIDSAAPGKVGNMALAAHNDIYGEIFRDLDQLSPGDEIMVSTELREYTYVVREIQIVDPTDVWVLEPTEFASTTLISCYPYRVNTQRIVVFADLVDTQG